MKQIKKYLSLIKFSHTIFAMPFALIGFVLGLKETNFKFSMLTLILVILCMVFARSAAMAFNRYLDRNFDAKNPRTALREIPAGILSKENVLRFIILNCLLFILSTYFINSICFYLSPIALLVVLGYSYTKRFTALCHIILGIGLALAPIGAYLAVTGKFNLLPILFSLTVLFWVSGFDIIYALQDEEFDRENKLFSIPSWLGKKNGLRISELLHLFCVVCFFMAGIVGQLGIMYWLGAIVFLALLVYQHLIVKPNDLKRVNLAFMTTNGIASVVFSIFVIIDLIVG